MQFVTETWRLARLQIAGKLSKARDGKASPPPSILRIYPIELTQVSGIVLDRRCQKPHVQSVISQPFNRETRPPHLSLSLRGVRPSVIVVHLAKAFRMFRVFCRVHASIHPVATARTGSPR